jgi:hypothetical protein
MEVLVRKQIALPLPHLLPSAPLCKARMCYARMATVEVLLLLLQEEHQVMLTLGLMVIKQIQHQTSAAGTYALTVKDANGCMKTDSVIITENSAIVLTVSKTNSTSGQNNGSASVSASGGTPGYSYAWSNGAQTAAVTGLAPGTYTLTVKDANGCESQSSITIESSTSITAIQTFYLKVYPNPANEVVYIELPDNILLEQFRLTDVIGRIVNVETEYNNHRLTIQTASLAAAVYEISIRTNAGNVKQKLIVER